MTEDSFEPLTDEDASAHVAFAAMAADEATLRRAIAAVLDQCDALHQSKSRYRETANGKPVGGNPHVHALCQTRADVHEHAAEKLEEALIEAFGLWDNAPVRSVGGLNWA